MASVNRLKIDVEAMRMVANSIEKCSQDMDDIIDFMERIEKKSSKEWNASTSGKFIAKCKSLRTDASKLNESMAKRSKDLTEIAQEYDELKKAISGKVNNLNPKEVFPNAT